MAKLVLTAKVGDLVFGLTKRERGKEREREKEKERERGREKEGAREGGREKDRNSEREGGKVTAFEGPELHG